MLDGDHLHVSELFHHLIIDHLEAAGRTFSTLRADDMVEGLTLLFSKSCILTFSDPTAVNIGFTVVSF